VREKVPFMGLGFGMKFWRKVLKSETRWGKGRELQKCGLQSRRKLGEKKRIKETEGALSWVRNLRGKSLL